MMRILKIPYPLSKEANVNSKFQRLILTLTLWYEQPARGSIIPEILVKMLHVSVRSSIILLN